MRTRLAAFVSFLFIAEVVASWWVWGGAPTDTIRVRYSDYWAFEAGRLRYWIPIVLTALVVLGIPVYARVRSRGQFARLLLAAVLGLVTELATTFLYWRSPGSSVIRGLYQSIWVGNRLPHSRELGWLSFRVYLCDHLVPWALALFVAVIAWVFFDRKAWSVTWNSIAKGA
jgi:hypothetical protein